jgi:hypothetical protein
MDYKDNPYASKQTNFRNSKTVQSTRSMSAAHQYPNERAAAA